MAVKRQLIVQSKLSCTGLVATLIELGAYTLVCVIQGKYWVEDNIQVTTSEGQCCSSTENSQSMI